MAYHLQRASAAARAPDTFADVEEIVSINTSACMESLPCKHFVTLRRRGQSAPERNAVLDARQIAALCIRLKHAVPPHFRQYCSLELVAAEQAPAPPAASSTPCALL